MKPVALADEALEEASEAAEWYEGERLGLAAEFLGELDRILSILPVRPRAFPRLLDPDPKLGIRRALLPRFPYAVIFQELDEEIRVLAVCHTKRRPGYWLDRVDG